MCDILCRWLNNDLRLSQSVDPHTLSKDFSNGYLIGEILHKYQLQEDFSMFIKSNTSTSKVNNFTRIEPTLHLLGVTFDMNIAQALMLGQQDAAARLLYQLYILLQKKKRAGITLAAMETMLSSVFPRLDKKEKEIYSDLRVSRQRHNELMAPIQASIIQVQKPSSKPLQRQRQQQQLRREQQTQWVKSEIAQFEKNRKTLETTYFSSSTSGSYKNVAGGGGAELVLQSNSEYMQRIRERLTEDTGEREQREKRRRYFLQEQLTAHEAQQETLRDEQLVKRLTRQTEQERRLAVQLMQMRMQKEVIRENRLFRECQYQEQRERDFLVALEREAALAQQARLDRAEEVRKEIELRNRIAAERAHNKYKKHCKSCLEVLDQIVDLSTKVGEYHLPKQIPGKLMREWKELLFRGLPLYYDSQQPDHGSSPPLEPVELEKQEILNSQDYQEYTNMVGEWMWPEEAGEAKCPPGNNNILGHAVLRMKTIVPPPSPGRPVPQFTLKACVLGKQYTGKSTCLSKLAQVNGIHVISPDKLIEEALYANLNGEETSAAFQATPQRSGQTLTNGGAAPRTRSCPAALGRQSFGGSGEDSDADPRRGLPTPASGSIAPRTRSCPAALDRQSFGGDGVSNKDLTSTQLNDDTSEPELSVRTQHGVSAEQELRKGKAIPDELLVDMIVEAIRQIPAHSGWVLDGFPGTISQAQLLEKALGGWIHPSNRAAHRAKSNSKANLAADPSAPPKPPPPAPVLDIVLLLDVTDDSILYRAAQQTYAEESTPESLQAAALYPVVERSECHTTKGDPVNNSIPSAGPTSAAAGCTDTDAAVMPITDRSLEKYQIQHSITAFHDTWSKLEKWYGRGQGILVRLDADVNEEELYSRVESALQQAMKPKDSGRATEASPPATAPHQDPALGPTESISSLQQEQACSVKYQTSKSNTNSPRGQTRRDCSSPNEDSVRDPNGASECESPCPGSAGWIYIEEPLAPEIPEYLFPYWETVCESYVNKVKAVMQNLRSERDITIRHHANIREEYKHYLGRPDLKQEFVTQWQQGYNSIPEDMRDDNDTKAELHLRLDDMCERLWDICDKRKEEDGQEKKAVLVRNGWLEDHTAILMNDYATLMQAEVDRFQDTLVVLKDYYLGMYRPLPSHFTTDTEDPPQEDRRSIATELLPKLSGGLQQGQPDKTSNEKIYQAALAAINNLVSAEAQRRELEVREESRRQKEASASTKKNKKKTPAKKTPAKKKKKKGPPSPSPAPTPPLTEGESSEEIHQREVRAKIHKEFSAALNHEEQAAQTRIGLVRGCALVMVHSLQKETEDSVSSVDEWLATRYLSEMNSIDRLTKVVRQQIELGSQLHSELVLESTDFYVNGDLCVVDCQPPPPRPPPLEKPTASTFTVSQLESLHKQLRTVAPSGFMSSADFTNVLQDLTSFNIFCSPLPEQWISMCDTQLIEIVSLFTLEFEVVDWRKFLLSAALPWPVPTLTQLLVLLQGFHTADTGNTGYVNQEQYLQIELWFRSETSQPIPEDPTEPLPYDRLANLRMFFFQLFAEHSSCHPRLDYVLMLQYLAAHPEPGLGFIRTLGLVVWKHLRRPSISRFVKSMPNINEAREPGTLVHETEEEDSEEDAPCGSSSGLREQGVSIAALLSVMFPRAIHTTGHTRFHLGCRTLEDHTEDLVHIFGELGYGPEEHVPFSVLCQHPLAQGFMEGSPRYQLIDSQSVLRAK